MEKMLTKGYVDQYFVMSAIILAFLIFINPFLAILFFVFAAYKFKQDLKKGVIFLLIAAVAYYFIRSFLISQVVVLSLPHMHISFWKVLLALLIFVSTIYSGWISRNIYEVLFSSSLIIFITILFNTFTFDTPLLLRIYTLTPLLSTLLPLLILAVRDYDSEEYLGKILDD
jgi:hypothetical protein